MIVSVAAQSHLESGAALVASLAVGSAAFDTPIVFPGPTRTRLLIVLPLSSRPASPGRNAGPLATGAVSSLVWTGPPSTEEA